MAQQQAALSLTTTERAATVIKIDGRGYALKHPDSLPIGVLRKFGRLSTRVHELSELDDPSDAESAELSDLLAEFTRQAMDAPAEVQARLTDLQRMEILGVFIKLRSKWTTTTAAPTHPANPRRSAKRSRG